MEELLYRLGLKKKSRTEKVKDSLSDVVHTIGDALDQAVSEGKKEAPKAAKKAQKQLKVAQEKASEAADSARDRSSEVADTMRSQGAEAREAAREQADHVSELLGELGQEASSKSAALLALLGGLTANWDEIAQSLSDEMEQRRATVEESAEEAKQKAKQVRQKAKRKRKGYPRFFVWLLRLGVGVWFIESLRSKDVAEYINHGAGEQMRAQSEQQPFPWYKDLLDNTFIPNASLFGMARVVLEGLTALGYITGINRRLAALAGITLSSNDLVAEYNDHNQRGQNIVLLLAQLLLLRTGG